MSQKYYETKWDGLSNIQKYELAKESENLLARFLINHCGFKHIIPTRDSMITMAKDHNIILPDLQGAHKNNEVYFIELKDKNRRMKFNDNGIDCSKAEAYLRAQREFGFKVLLVFLDDEKEWKPKYPQIDSWFKDDDNQCVYYGNWIDKLHQETPITPVTITTGIGGKRVKCFPLKNMRKIEELFKERQTTLNFGVTN